MISNGEHSTYSTITIPRLYSVGDTTYRPTVTVITESMWDDAINNYIKLYGCKPIPLEVIVDSRGNIIDDENSFIVPDDILFSTIGYVYDISGYNFITANVKKRYERTVTRLIWQNGFKAMLYASYDSTCCNDDYITQIVNPDMVRKNYIEADDVNPYMDIFNIDIKSFVLVREDMKWKGARYAIKNRKSWDGEYRSDN